MSPKDTHLCCAKTCILSHGLLPSVNIMYRITVSPLPVPVHIQFSYAMCCAVMCVYNYRPIVGKNGYCMYDCTEQPNKG